MQRIESRLCGASDYDHDEKIDKQVERECDGYWKRLKRLEAEKEKLPKINTWDIGAIPNWEQYVVEQAEKLRGLLGGVVPHSDVPIDYPLAYALAEFAHLKNSLEVKSTEWEIKRVEVLSLMRKRDFSFKSTVDGEQELRELENQIAVIKEQFQKCGKEIWEAYDHIRARETTVGS